LAAERQTKSPPTLLTLQIDFVLWWRAQGDDFRTFLGQFVAAMGQFDFPFGF
jgi:hypothetical protein